MDKTMVEETTIKDLKDCMENNMPVLFLGAGFSREALCKKGKLPTGSELADELRLEFVKDKISEADYKDVEKYNLRELCSCIDALDKDNKAKREEYLTRRLKGALPNETGFHNLLVDYPWRRIYTVNIDDLVENIYEENDKEYSCISSSKDIPRKSENMELIKLHGSVRKPGDGYIFSKKEYNDLIGSKVNIGLVEFTNEIYSVNDVIFIGASLDEPDIEYYLQLYENMQIKRKKSRIFFIEPYPKLALEQKAAELGATIIPWTTEKFLKFTSELEYAPERAERARLELNRSMIYRLQDDIKIFKNPYESNIYQGYYSTWQDVFDRWTFKNTMLDSAKKSLDIILSQKDPLKCFCLYGSSFSGKSTLLKQLGYYLYSMGYEVLEYKGRFLERSVLRNYIMESSYEKYAILIDNASFYYKTIERFLRDSYEEKEIVFLCASRTYYHTRKKYYLEGNCFCDLECKDKIRKEDAPIIAQTLEEKDSLGDLYEFDHDSNELYREIQRKQSVVNLIVYLTYGKEMRRKLNKEMKFVTDLPLIEMKLLLEVAIFNNLDIEYYPIELFIGRYQGVIRLTEEGGISNLKVIDYIKYDDQGIALRNSLLQDAVLKSNRDKIFPAIRELLLYMSTYVYEGRQDVWMNVFQALLNEARLREKFKSEKSELGTLFYGIKQEYTKVSYYWLQLGLYEQGENNYAKALSHLKKSQKIQPKSFKIQHAIARNYLKYANVQSDSQTAKELFEKGEKLMLDLIKSKEYYIQKAKLFSVDSYVLEKVRYVEKFHVKLSNKELNEMRDMLSEVYSPNDSYIYKAMKVFYQMLCRIGKQSIIRMDFNSPYYDIMKKEFAGDDEFENTIYCEE